MAENPAEIAQVAERLIDLRIPNPLRVGEEHDMEASGVYGWDELQRLAVALTPLLAQAWDEGATKASSHGGGYLRSFLIENPYRDVVNSPGSDSPEEGS